MKIFDFNIHLPVLKSSDVNEVIADDMSLTMEGLRAALSVHREALSTLSGMNVLLFNQDLFRSPSDLTGLFSAYRAYFTALFDFRRADAGEYLEAASAAGVRCVMFNSYLQRIREEDFAAVLKVCRLAEIKKMIICVDGSFGTTKMFVYDNIRLMAAVAETISRVPVVIVHSGGRRILETMLIALEKRNVWLDTSFSLPYYIGSSVEKDFAFACRKIGTDRVVYGSDHPYMEMAETVRIHGEFFDCHGFSASDREKIFHDNAMRLFEG